jgi:hypothetical protein
LLIILYFSTILCQTREFRTFAHVPPRLTPDAGLAIVHTTAFIPTRSCEKPIMALSFPFPHIDTKLHVPTTRPGLVARPRLSRQLDRCVQHKLLLVCAPAGFGKTTLLSQWSQQSARPVAWVLLGATDNDPTHFWSYGVSGVGALTTEEAALFDQVRTRYGCTTSPMPLGGSIAGGTMPSRSRASSTTIRGRPCASSAASARTNAPSASPSVRGCR